MVFEIVGEIRQVETIASGRSVHIRGILKKTTVRAAGESERVSPQSNFLTDQLLKPKFIGMKRLELDARDSKSRGSSHENVCNMPG
jgi:hypothetical protein